jgi:lipopolysaccharide export LptBFGC system permease protein LptF
VGLLSRYILRQVWIPALLASLVISVVVIGRAIQASVQGLLEQFPVVQITVWDLSRLSVFALPTLVGYIIPITFLLGIMLTFGRMAEQSELTAMRAAGIPLKRAVLPVLWAGLALSLLCFFIQDRGQPWAYAQINRLFTNELPLRMSLDMLPTGVMHTYGDWRIYIGGKEDDVLQDIVVLKPTGEGQASAYYAERAYVQSEPGQPAALVMEAGHLVNPSDADKQVPRTQFEHFRIAVPLIEAPPAEAERESMTLVQLFRFRGKVAEKFYDPAENADQGRNEAGRELRKAQQDISERLSFPLMCLAVALVAAPIGARTGRGGRSRAFAWGVLVIGSYFLLRKMVEPGLAPLPLTLFLGQVPNLALAVAGALLIRRVDRV